MLTPDEIREMNEAYRQDFNRHDADAFRRYYADRINWTGPGPADPVTDGDEIPDRYRALFRSFPDVHIEFLNDFFRGLL